MPEELKHMKEAVKSIIESTDTLTEESISGTAYTQTVTEEKTLTYDDSVELIKYLEKQGYIDKKQKMNKKLTEDIKNGTFDVPHHLQAAKNIIENIIKRADNKPIVRDASKDVVVRLKKQVIEESPEFQALWDKIKQKTTYRVDIDTDKLIAKSVKH